MGEPMIDIQFAAMPLNLECTEEANYAWWLEEVKECGYDGITGFAHWGMESFIEQPNALRKLLQANDLQLASVNVTEQNDLNYYHKICEFLAYNQCSNMVYIDPKGGPKEYDRLANKLNTNGELVSSTGVRVLYHNLIHAGSESALRK